MEKLKTLGGYIISGITLLGFIIIYGVWKAHSFNIYIFGVGVLLLIPGLVYFFISSLKNQTDEEEKYLNDLKIKGHKILVDLTKSQIVSNSWTTERESNNNSTIVFNELIGNSYDNRTTDDLSFSRIKYTCDFNGTNSIFISSPIAKDKVTLEILLEMQKETFIYVDRDNPNKFYFDLEFLNN